MRKFIAVALTVVLSICTLGCKGDAEYISFHDEKIKRADLSYETIQWLEGYNELTEEEQLSISYIPSEIYSVIFDDAAYGMEQVAEPGN